jgi:hypothetical protein
MTNYKIIYVIVDTETNEFVTINHKAAWTKVGNAKNAWNTQQGWRSNKTLFGEQSRYVVKPIELTQGSF